MVQNAVHAGEETKPCMGTPGKSAHNNALKRYPKKIETQQGRRAIAGLVVCEFLVVCGSVLFVSARGGLIDRRSVLFWFSQAGARNHPQQHQHGAAPAIALLALDKCHHAFKLTQPAPDSFFKHR